MILYTLKNILDNFLEGAARGMWQPYGTLFFVFLLIIFCSVLYLFKWLIVKKGKQFLTVSTSLCNSIKEAVLKNEHVFLWMQKHQYIVSFLKARFDTTAFSGRTLTIFTLALVYVLALFAGVVEDLITSDSIIALDIRTSNFFFLFRTDALTNIFTWITLLGKSQVILVFIFISVVVLWLWQKKYCILSLFISVTGSQAFTHLGKLAFHRPRPEMAVYAEHTFSFPSGHATIAVSFYGFLAYLAMRSVQSWNKKVNIFFGTTLLILAIGFSRIYLGVHYISDVWSGYFVGVMWLIIAVFFSEWLRHKGRCDQFISHVAGARPITFVLVFIGILFYVGFSMNYNSLER